MEQRIIREPIIIAFLTFLLFIGCRNKTDRYQIPSKIECITLVRNTNEFLTHFGVVRMDDLPSDFLVSPGLRKTAIDSIIVLEKLSTILKNTVKVHSDALLISYDTDFVVLVQYSGGSRVDTIGVSFDQNRPIIIGQQLFKNPKLSKYLIELLCNTDGNLKKYLDDCYYEEKFSFWGKPEFSSTSALPPDYGIFAGTSLESLAIEMMRGDTIASRKLIENNPALLKNAYDDCSGTVGLYDIGKGPLLITSCIKYQQNDMLRLLLSLGANPELTDGLNGENTALMAACENSHLMESAFILIDAGAKVDSPLNNRICATPLQVCVINRNLRMGEYLIRHGAKVETVNYKGQNAFDLAIIRRYYKMAYLFTLLGYKPDSIKISQDSLISCDKYIESHPSPITTDMEYSKRLLQVLGK